MHILRSSPYDGHMTLTSISDVLRDCIIQMAYASNNDLQWSHTTLSVKVGELGFRSPMTCVIDVSGLIIKYSTIAE